MPDLSVEAIGKLSPSELVALVDQLEPSSEAIAALDIDAIAKAIDPAKLRGTEFFQLIAGLERLAGANTGVDLGRMGPQTFARLISSASKEQLADVLDRAELRTLILTEIFRRMQAHLRPERADGVDAIVHWRFSGGTGDGGYDRYESVIVDGTCATNRTMAGQAKVTITMPPYDFLKLITNNASAPVLFMTGKLKVRGDLGFAATMLSLFDLPKA